MQGGPGVTNGGGKGRRTTTFSPPTGLANRHPEAGRDLPSPISCTDQDDVIRNLSRSVQQMQQTLTQLSLRSTARQSDRAQRATIDDDTAAIQPADEARQWRLGTDDRLDSGGEWGLDEDGWGMAGGPWAPRPSTAARADPSRPWSANTGRPSQDRALSQAEISYHCIGVPGGLSECDVTLHKERLAMRTPDMKFDARVTIKATDYDAIVAYLDNLFCMGATDFEIMKAALALTPLETAVWRSANARGAASSYGRWRVIYMQYKDLENQPLLRAKAKQLRQLKGAPVTTYISIKEEMYHKAGLTNTPDVIQDVLDGMLPAIATHIRLASPFPTTIQELMAAAAKIEGVLALEASNTPARKVAFTRTYKSTQSDDDDDYADAKVVAPAKRSRDDREAAEKKQQQVDQEREEKEVAEGPLHATIRGKQIVYRALKDTAKTTRRRVTGGDGTAACYICGSFEHFIRSCPYRYEVRQAVKNKEGAGPVQRHDQGNVDAPAQPHSGQEQLQPKSSSLDMEET